MVQAKLKTSLTVQGNRLEEQDLHSSHSVHNKQVSILEEQDLHISHSVHNMHVSIQEEQDLHSSLSVHNIRDQSSWPSLATAPLCPPSPSQSTHISHSTHEVLAFYIKNHMTFNASDSEPDH